MSTDIQGPYYDPYDFEIDADPYPLWKRMRDEAPLYYNERYDFYALTRFDDVERGLVDWKTYISGNGSVLEMIKANMEIPPGSILFEDPPAHDEHRALLSRVFTPRRMLEIEPKVREFCARSLDPLVGSGGFDFIRDLGAQMPMRTIGMLLGIPEEEQERIRDRIDEGMRLKSDSMPGSEESYGVLATSDFEDFVDLEDQAPLRRPDDRALERRVRRRQRKGPQAHPGRGAQLHQSACRSRKRDHHAADRLDRKGARGAPGPAPGARRGPIAHSQCDRGAAALRGAVAGSGPRVTRDVEHWGTTVPAGSVMLLINASANRDEREFDSPDQFDIHRKIGHHLTFGYGIHFCLGTHLARLEGRVALDEVLKRFPRWEVDWDHAEQAHTSTVRGWERLPVTTG